MAFEGQSIDSVPVIIDTGSCTVKGGFAGDDAPRTVFPCIVFVPRSSKLCMIGMNIQDCYVGDEVGNSGSRNLISQFPLENGVVTNWGWMEKIWHHTFYNELRVCPEEHPIVMSEPALNPKANREEMARIMFEEFQVPALHVTMQSILALYSSGRTSGSVVDVGESVTYVVPVYERYALSHGIAKLDIGGSQLTDYMMSIVSAGSGRYFTTRAEKEIMRDIKDKLCYIALNYEAELEAASIDAGQDTKPSALLPKPEKDGVFKLTLRLLSGEVAWEGSVNLQEKVTDLFGRISLLFSTQSAADYHELIIDGVHVGEHQYIGSYVSVDCSHVDALLITFKKIRKNYELSDGDVITVATERFRCPEVLFKPHLLSIETDGIHALVFSSIMRCDESVRDTLFANILLAGGSTMFDGMQRRLAKELKMLTASVIKIIAPPLRKYAAWIGGSAFASQDNLEKDFITREEYDEVGPSIVHTKCP